LGGEPFRLVTETAPTAVKWRGTSETVPEGCLRLQPNIEKF
jgi:hypothetical protein